MAALLLSVMGAFAEFERALIRERQREGIALAKQRGAYRGRKTALAADAVAELRRRVAAGEKKAQVARDMRISRETLYHYLRMAHRTRSTPAPPLPPPRVSHRRLAGGGLRNVLADAVAG